jgi:uncharacterized protein YndB with AHSA1/START domain
MLPRQEVFEAWTNAESVKQWMCPEGSSVSFVELDVRVGGAFRVDMHVDGVDTIHTGIYREIIPRRSSSLPGFPSIPTTASPS